MRVKLVASGMYDGLGIKNFRKLESKDVREVHLIGIPTPVDPGIVRILDGAEEKDVPKLLLEGVPNFSFEPFLSPEQIQERKDMGVLVGSGFCSQGKEQGMIPIEQIGC